jgi:hypothetical protein
MATVRVREIELHSQEIFFADKLYKNGILVMFPVLQEEIKSGEQVTVTGKIHIIKSFGKHRSFYKDSGVRKVNAKAPTSQNITLADRGSGHYQNCRKHKFSMIKMGTNKFSA